MCVALAYTEVVGQRDQHSAVVHEAGRLAAVVQLPVPGEEQWGLETHRTCGGTSGADAVGPFLKKKPTTEATHAGRYKPSMNN